MPPAEIPANQLWLQITQLPRPYKDVDYPKCLPGTDTPIGQVRIWILTQEELQQSTISAETYARKFLKDSPVEAIGYQDVYKNQAAVELLFRACRRVDNDMYSFFPSPREMREKLTSDEVGVLTSLYMTVQHELGPIVSVMSDMEFDAWVKRLAKGGEEYPLALLSWEMRNELTMRMASLLNSLQTDKSLPGLPLESESLSQTAPSEDDVE